MEINMKFVGFYKDKTDIYPVTLSCFYFSTFQVLYAPFYHLYCNLVAIKVYSLVKLTSYGFSS
jgi:hypothetical protein